MKNVGTKICGSALFSLTALRERERSFFSPVFVTEKGMDRAEFVGIDQILYLEIRNYKSKAHIIVFFCQFNFSSAELKIQISLYLLLFHETH